MVLEHALMHVTPGEEERFEGVLDEALGVITSAEGCLGARIRRGIESPSTYLLEVEWTTVAAHTEGFRSSELFARWRALMSPFWVELPVVEHFSLAAERAG
jgi:heme-degrading monooxygenase HmoA